MTADTHENATAPRRVMHFLESGGLYGAESVVLNLSREMLKNDEYVPVVACIVQHPSEQVALYDEARLYGVEAHKIVVNNWKFPIDILAFLMKSRALKIDLIHSHGYKASIIGFFAMVLLRTPLLPTCHLWFWGKQSPLKFRMMTAIEIFLYRFFRVITVVSQPIKQTLVERGVRPERIHIIKNGINLDDFMPISAEERQRLRCECTLSDVPVIVNLGRLTEQKAHVNIIRAAKVMKSKGMSFIVLIIGDGELRTELEQRIQECGVENEVRLLGFRNNARILLQVADVFLLSSLDEGLPMALLEAMASKIPVVATGVGDIPDLLAGKCGMIIPPNDIEAIVESVEMLMSNSIGRLELIRNSYKKVRDCYSSQAMYGEYSRLYEVMNVT